MDDPEIALVNVDDLDLDDPTLAPAFRAAMLRGLEDSKAGRMIPIEKVIAWVDSWGTDHELPMPECE